MKKPAIPSVPKPGEDRRRFDEAIKGNIEIVTARRADPLAPLAADASLPEAVEKLNALLKRFQE